MRFKSFTFLFSILFLCSLNFSFARATDQNTAPLTFQARVEYQHAIEEIYWRHRIWPKENPGPKPPLEKILPDSAIISKVEDYLRKSNALDQYWQRPITAQQLQAEIDRMAKQTKQPAMLKEIFDALNNDPHVVAECLARPALVERLIHNWYANDEQFHGFLKAQVQSELKRYGTAERMQWLSGKYQETTWKKRAVEEKERFDVPSEKSISLDSSEWQGWMEELQRTFSGGMDLGAMGTLLQEPNEHQIRNESLPTNQLSKLQEDVDRFYITAILEQDNSHVKLATVEWKKRSFEDWWKEASVSVRSEIVAPSFTYHFSASLTRASPCTDDTWAQTYIGVPMERRGHTAVWTGNEMIIWGGSAGDGGYPTTLKLNTGGRYNPATDSWLPGGTNTNNAPEARQDHTAIWTGTEMIVWGGSNSGGFLLNTGGRYNPSSDSWATGGTSMTNAPVARSFYTAIWTGTEMIVWGGINIGGFINTGGRYNPSSDSWAISGTSATNVPSPRGSHSAIWTGSEMIVWGGTGTALSPGGRYDPSTDSWAPGGITTMNESSARTKHSAVWTGNEMIVWGGYLLYGGPNTNTGGRYNPSTDSWVLGGTNRMDAPGPMAGHTAIWSGAEMIVWGGGYNTGGLYSPSTDNWIRTSVINAPTPSGGYTAIWTGGEMIVWGGGDNSGKMTNTGGRYSPSTNSWVPGGTSTIGAPTRRATHTAIWTGTEMIIWGGVWPNNGGSYFPALDSWLAISTVDAPRGQSSHRAIWTGTEMIVWGGLVLGGLHNTGGRYNPTTDSWASGGTSMINAPTGHLEHTAIWTGSEMIIWGGITDPFGYTNTGGRYNPSTDTWVPNGTSIIDAPIPRYGHTAIWTGTEMIVWGGLWGDSLNTGGRYNPSTDSWVSGGTSITNAPEARMDHKAVWTGAEMIVWGGSEAYYGESLVNTGGRYNPSSDSWSLGGTTTNNAPTPRFEFTADWTGSEMIVWGGSGSDNLVTNTGGRYSPSSDTWTATSNSSLPEARYRHTAIWTGTELIVWGGHYSTFAYAPTNSGGRYCAANTRLSISDVLVEEGKKGGKTLKFVVTLSNPVDFSVKVDYATADGTAEAGKDYVAKSGTKRIGRGKIMTTIKIKVRGDKIPEADETFTVNLMNAVGVGIADAQGIGTIMNDD